MLPRMEAEDTIKMQNAVAYGFGTMNKSDAGKHRAALQRQLGGSRRKVKLEAPSAASFAELGATVGVKRAGASQSAPGASK